MKELIKEYLRNSLNTNRALRKKIVLLEEQIEKMIENAKEREIVKEELSEKASKMQKKAAELNKKNILLEAENKQAVELVKKLTKKVEKLENERAKREKDTTTKKRRTKNG